MEKTIFRAFLIKYAEIAIKGKNRYMFEDALEVILLILRYNNLSLLL